MTDGILLEMQRDRDLRRYDTIIIDEAHERGPSSIDFILGYLRQLLPRRSRPQGRHHVRDDRSPALLRGALRRRRRAPAPIIEGPAHLPELRYRPLVDRRRRRGSRGKDQVTGICGGRRGLTPLRDEPHDILVFLSGGPKQAEEIRHAADALGGMEKLPVTEISCRGEQHRVFARHGGGRASFSRRTSQTSLTVPASATSSTRAPRASAATARDEGAAAADRAGDRRRRPTSARAAAAASPTASAIRLYSEEDFETAGPSSPTPRSCAPSSRRSSCR